MKITSKSRTAIMAMVYLGAEDGELKPVALSKIAQENDLSLQFLEQIFSKLRKKNLVQSVRGIHGGYILSKKSNCISIYEIVDAIDEVEVSTRCSNQNSCLPSSNRCLTHHLWKKLDKTTYDFLKKTTLQNVLLNQYGEL